MREEGGAEGEESLDELQEEVIFDLLTGETRKATLKEKAVQRMIEALAQEYHFPLEGMARDVKISVEIDGRRRTRTADLVIFEADAPHELEHAIRIVVAQAEDVKVTDRNRGIDLLKDLLFSVDNCEFGVWTNGKDISYLRRLRGPIQDAFDELSDFPGAGETLEDLDRPDRRVARIAVAEDLRDTILRCHDYLYGNQSMRAEQAFGEMVKLIFCKIFDERLLRESSQAERRFWVRTTERNDADGQAAIAERITALFDLVKADRDLREIFHPADEIRLQPKPLAWVAGELARYQFLDTAVDVKGMAYEAMVATTMKRERGQFFTPRNVVKAMVDILAPGPEDRVLDPAAGTGRFLVACLDRERDRLAHLHGGPDASQTELRRLRNRPDVVSDSVAYARRCLFGVDVDPEMQRAAKMNMLINDDGHSNLFLNNALEVTTSEVGPSSKSFPGASELGFGTFDVVLTNPPFGAKIPIDDPNVLEQYDLGHSWRRTEAGPWLMDHARTRPKMPPEILFIERCLQWLKPGGRMGIVLPDGILGNPDNEPIRQWILEHARVLASIDLPVEAFLPQVGVQASLLFLQKKTKAEIVAGADGDYPIFMAVAEAVGHDRRGATVYRRDADGYELYNERPREFIVRRGGEEVIERRFVREREIADDLPLISSAYRIYNERGEIPDLVSA